MRGDEEGRQEEGRHEEVTDAAAISASKARVRASYRLWVNNERTLLVRLWDDGKMEVATRSEPDATWGPPVYLNEEDG